MCYYAVTWWDSIIGYLAIVNKCELKALFINNILHLAMRLMF